MRRGLVALAVFAAFVVVAALFRGGPAEVIATAQPDGTWGTVSCGSLPNGSGLEEARARCLASGGSPRFLLTVRNATEGTVAVTSCTVEATGMDGAPFASAEPIVVPVRAIQGVPYAAAYLEPGSAVAMKWFVPWLGSDVEVNYEATCDWAPSSGAPPL